MEAETIYEIPDVVTRPKFITKLEKFWCKLRLMCAKK